MYSEIDVANPLFASSKNEESNILELVANDVAYSNTNQAKLFEKKLFNSEVKSIVKF